MNKKLPVSLLLIATIAMLATTICIEVHTLSTSRKQQELTSTRRSNEEYDALKVKHDELEKEIENLRWFKKTYLKAYDERQGAKKNYERATMILEKVRVKYNIPREEILKLQLCTCPTTSPCYKGEPCNLPQCPVCKSTDDKKDSEPTTESTK